MFQKLRRNLNRHLFGIDPDYHDPYKDPAEQFYARIYLKYLFEQIEIAFRNQSLKILDVGCHTGRLSVPLACAGHQVTAVDSSGFHLQQAVRHAREAGVPCRFLRGDGFHHCRRFPPESFDLVLSTEVLYQIPDFRQRMEDMVRVLRTGGLLVTSHRTRFFYLAGAIRERDFESTRTLLNHSEGSLKGSYFNWQSPDELGEIYEQLSLDLLRMRPVGIFTGNQGEGMAGVYDLAKASVTEREALFEIESYDSEELAAAGRYLLAIGRKREALR